MKTMICRDYKKCRDRLECPHAIPHEYEEYYCSNSEIIDDGYYTSEKCTCINVRLEKLKKLNISK